MIKRLALYLLIASILLITFYGGIKYWEKNKINNREIPVTYIKSTIPKPEVVKPKICKQIINILNYGSPELEAIKKKSKLYKEYVDKDNNKKAFFCSTYVEEYDKTRYRVENIGYLLFKKDKVLVGRYSFNIQYGPIHLLWPKFEEVDVNSDGHNDISFTGTCSGVIYIYDAVIIFDLFNNNEYFLEKTMYRSSRDSTDNQIDLLWSPELNDDTNRLIKAYMFLIHKEKIPLNNENNSYSYIYHEK